MKKLFEDLEDKHEQLTNVLWQAEGLREDIKKLEEKLYMVAGGDKSCLQHNLKVFEKDTKLNLVK